MQKNTGNEGTKRKSGNEDKADDEKRELIRFMMGKKSTCSSGLSLDTILTDDLLEHIFSYLLIESVVRAGAVCKKWREITSSKRFLRSLLQKPWYFKISAYCERGYVEEIWHAYDSVLQKWHCMDLPFVKQSCSCAPLDSSCGLLCFMEHDDLCVCNPMTRQHKKLQEPPSLSDSYRPTTLKILVNRRSNDYNVLFVKRKDMIAPDNSPQCELSFQVYDSATMEWATSQMDVVTGCVDGGKSVICDGVLYLATQDKIDHDSLPNVEQGLLAYKFSSILSSHGTLMKGFIRSPCQLMLIHTLMNLNEKLVIVGLKSIEKLDQPGNWSGYGIWLLDGNEWQLISCLPRMNFRYLDLACCCGTEDLIFIQFSDNAELLVFDLNLKQWSWSPRSWSPTYPLTEWLSILTSFCLEPRLDISP